MTDTRFDPSTADGRWQRAWEEAGTFTADSGSARPKSYILEMFPYPSGRIHMGHVRNYTMGDVLARYKRMRGHEVLHPMGWDAFGMPAENAAMEKKVHPGSWTKANIEQMKAQLKRIGFALDWTREFATCDPEYYGHEQALFLDMVEAGLVYRKESTVNWDPVDMTVLANEQVIDGKGWRSGAEVEKRKLNQWFLKITDFAEELLEGLGDLEDWPDKVKLMQENWIGKSQGLEFSFALSDGGTLPVYTTRPDTIFGASFCAIAAEHPIAQGLAGDPEVAAFIEECRKGPATAAALEAAGYSADQVDTVVLTHMHGDHIGGLMTDGAPTFSNASYVTGQTEYDFWADAGNEGFDNMVRPLADKMTFLQDGGDVTGGVTAMAAFGHTPGHMAYMIENGGQQLVLGADFANHYVWSLAHPEWEVKFDRDKEAAAETRKRILDMLAADNIPFVGYHMPWPGVGYVDTRGGGYHYVPHTYQLLL
jgi:glyoxylase-like metal-dependent hydrolase (beta-lactamase superfamily II)